MNSEQEQIILAQNSREDYILKQLSKSIYSSVRRTVAKNNSTPIQIIEMLCMDPALNVTYVANKFCQNNKIKREIISKNPCVICIVDEKEYINICPTCIKVNSSKY